jgi:hypothetical protein
MSAVKTELMEKGARVTHLISSSLSFGLWSRALLSCLSLGTNPTGIFAVEWEGLPFSCVVSSSLLPCYGYYPRVNSCRVWQRPALQPRQQQQQLQRAPRFSRRPQQPTDHHHKCWEKENVSLWPPTLLPASHTNCFLPPTLSTSLLHSSFSFSSPLACDRQRATTTKKVYEPTPKKRTRESNA